MAAAVDMNDNLIVAGCDNAVIGVWDAADAAEINLLTGESGSELIGFPISVTIRGRAVTYLDGDIVISLCLWTCKSQTHAKTLHMLYHRRLLTYLSRVL